MSRRRRVGALTSVALALSAAAGLVTAAARAQEAPATAAPGALAGSEIGTLRTARDALVAAADFVGARDPAARVVTALDDSPEGATPGDLLMLATIEANLGEIDAAEANFLRVIGMLESAGGEYSPALITPYQALGRTYINARRFAEARAALEQAQHISQRTAGLFNVEQSGIIDDLTMVEVGRGDTVAARSLQLQRLDNAVRRFGADDPRTIPYYVHLGDYYDQSRMRVSARAQYAKVLEIEEAEYGADDPRLLGTLRRLLETDIRLGRADEVKERLAQQVLVRPPDDPLERGLALAALGDWATAADETRLARQYYFDAYAALEQAGPDAVGSAFDAPRLLDFIPPLDRVDRGTRRRPYVWLPVELAFDVSATGRALDVEIVQSTADDTMDDAYVRRVREAHFRPRLVSGEPEPTRGVRYTHYYRRYVTDKGTDAEEGAAEDGEAAGAPAE